MLKTLHLVLIHAKAIECDVFNYWKNIDCEW